jgi:multidrug efflux pump subunit AcrB
MISFFTRHPTAANLLMLIIAVAGLVTLPTLKRETFPDFSSQEVEVRVVYPGASAADVEDAICERVEDAIDGISNVEEVRCESREGIAITVARLIEGADFSRFLDDVKTEVEAIDNFPDEAEPPTIKQLGRTDRVISIAVTGPMSPGHLRAYAEELKGRLQQLEDVSQVTITGFSTRQLKVEIPAVILYQYGLSIPDVAKVITNQSVNLPAGSIETSERDILLRFDDERRSVHELAELSIIGGESGAVLRLGDIATIRDGFELAEEKIFYDGQRAALLNITKTKQQDALNVVAAVKGFVAEEQRRAPPGVRFKLTQDMSSIIRDRLQMLLKNGWQGLVLVFATMWVFFRFKVAFWVAMGLPVSFLGGLFCMTLFGYSINMLTMVALLIALGLLMDDAIVIAENVVTHLKQGKSGLEAAIDGVRQVLPGVTSSFLTTVAVFGPLAFLSGEIGKVLKVLPVVLIMVLAVSLIEAFTILPNHLVHALHNAQAESTGRFRRWFEGRIAWLRQQAVGTIVDWAVTWRYPFLGAVVAIFLISIGMLAGGKLKFQAFPELDGDIVEARVLLPQGTPLARTEGVVDGILAALEKVHTEFSPQQPDGQALVQAVSVTYNLNSDAHESGPHVATVTADLLSSDIRTGRVDDILGLWRDAVGQVSDVISLTFKEPTIGPGGLAIDIRLNGPDLVALKSASLDLQAWLARYRGVSDLTDDLRPGKPELKLTFRESGLPLGVTAADIAQQLRAAYFGITAREITVRSEAYEIDVQLQDTDQASLGVLDSFLIRAPNGQQIPLAAIAEVQVQRGYARIHRIDGRRTVTVQGDVDARFANVNEVLSDTQQRFLPELERRYPSVHIAFEGEAKESGTTGASLQRGFLIGLTAIFVLLSFQFRSYIEPLVVMVAIPLGFVGVVWGHVLMGLDLSMPSMMGFASLSGIVVNDSILLVEFLKLRRREGMTVHDASRRASRERFRAVLLTSLTTIAGLIPLLFEKSLQAQVLIPLVTSIAFGLMVTTVLVLVVIPALFSVLDDFGLTSVSEETEESAGAVVQA